MIGGYLKYLKNKGRSPYTVYDAKRELKAFYRHIKKRKYTRVKKEDIENYYAYLVHKKGLKSGSLSRIFSAIFGYFKYLKEEGYILIEPTHNMPFPRRKKDGNLPSAPSCEDINKLLELPDRNTQKGMRDKAMFELMYSSGMRLSELVGLDIYDVDTKKREVFIRCGKGGDSRIVPIGEEAIRWLDEYIRNVRRLYIDKDSEKALFLSKYKQRIRRVTLVYLLRAYRDKIKTGSRLSCHRLRHACAVGMLRNGADIRMIQKLLGHRRITTTQVYTRVSPEDLKLMHERYHPRERMRIG